MDLNDLLGNAFKTACIQELEAIKPGNVHIFADGHGMTVQDFIASAEVVSQIIATPNLTLGQRILKSVQATQNAVGCNTNLGIILLCAPLIHAALMQNKLSLTANLKKVLASTSIEDAQDAFNAIKLANPAGLGASEQFDVNNVARCTLVEAMRFAAHRDLIAQQYANNFSDIKGLGVKSFNQSFRRLNHVTWSISALYLSFLAHHTDSHILKKKGEKLAKGVSLEAKDHLARFSCLTNPKLYLSELLAWDTRLKAASVNPGTSADMTVATLLFISIEHITRLKT